MDKLKKFIVSILSCTIVLTLAPCALAMDTYTENNEVLVKNFFESAGTGNWSQWAEYVARRYFFELLCSTRRLIIVSSAQQLTLMLLYLNSMLFAISATSSLVRALWSSSNAT